MLSSIIPFGIYPETQTWDKNIITLLNAYVNAG